jgi:RNA polymerase sigma factor (sigma-70 family)
LGVSLPPFQALLDSHRADVYRFLTATVGPVEADDCFQETWIAALRAYPRLKHGDNLRGWLLKIAQNKARDAHRARGRRAVPVEDVPDRGAHDARIAAVGADNPGLWARVRALPEKQRLAVVHRTVLDMGYAELAEVLDCSEDAARRNVHEGLKRLRRELGDD